MPFTKHPPNFPNMISSSYLFFEGNTLRLSIRNLQLIVWKLLDIYIPLVSAVHFIAWNLQNIRRLHSVQFHNHHSFVTHLSLNSSSIVPGQRWKKTSLPYTLAEILLVDELYFIRLHFDPHVIPALVYLKFQWRLSPMLQLFFLQLLTQ